MKWGILLGSASVGGGTYVIFQHAIYACEHGEEVTILTVQPVRPEELYWHKDAQKLGWRTIDEAADDTYDVLICTWWRLVYEAYRVKAKRYLYFVQSVESRFYAPGEKPLRQLAEATYMLPMDAITEATWIKTYLREQYNREALLVHNGIRKDIYRKDGECIAPREPGRLRVLVEGPVDVDFKNVPKTIRLCRESAADEIWLLTASGIDAYPGVDRVFSRVPIHETPSIYRSCDVIVKLSYVEGMFGPPLEMFHCGGTSITYDVTGHDEYIVDGYNGLVVHRDDEAAVVDGINRLKNEQGLLERLKTGALETADRWIDWNTSSERFMQAVSDLCMRQVKADQAVMEKESKFHFASYVIAEDYLNELKRIRKPLYIKLCDFIRKRFGVDF